MNHWMEDDVVEGNVRQLERKALQLFELNLNSRTLRLSQVEALKLYSFFKERILSRWVVAVDCHKLVIYRDRLSNAHVCRKIRPRSLLLLIAFDANREPVFRRVRIEIPVGTIAHVDSAVTLQRHQHVKNGAEPLVCPVPISSGLRVEPFSGKPRNDH